MRGLREAGLEVAVAAVDGDDRPLGALTDEERAATFVVNTRGAGGIVLDHLTTRPAGYLAGLARRCERRAGTSRGSPTKCSTSRRP